MSEFCRYCDNELSEEKGELGHGCLTCYCAPWVDKIKQLESEKVRLEKKLKEAEIIINMIVPDVEALAEKFKIAVEALKEVRESLNNQSGIHWRDIVHNALARIEHGENKE